ncbi:hypothetical protein WDW37_07335 [Bdellovibrionota bacterium FG-1]
MKYLKWVPLIITFGVGVTVAQARTIYFGSETEVVPIVYGGATIFRFSGEIRTISQAQRFQITPANGDSPNYALLSVTPRFATGSSEVAFIFNDGTIIKTRLVVVSRVIPEKTDSIYEFKSKETLIQPDGETKTGASMPELDLMKAIIRGDEVLGYEVRNLARSISPGIKGVNIQLVRIYTGNQFNGYIFEIVNTTKNQKLFVNVQNMSLGDPNVALLGSVDDALIEPKSTGRHKTHLRIVAKSTSIYNELRLPIQVAERK